MTTNRQNENRIGKVIPQSVGVKIAQTSLLPAIENLEKEQIQIQDWIKTLFRPRALISVHGSLTLCLKSKNRYFTS